MSEAYAASVASLLPQARRELRLISQTLPSAYYPEAVVEGLRAFLLSHERARLRVLIADSRAAARSRSPLVALGRQLSSRIAFRDTASDAPIDFAGERLLVDQEQGLELGAELGTTDAPRNLGRLLTQRLAEQFDRSWEQAMPSAELRALLL